MFGQSVTNRPSVMQYPTPQPGVSQMFEELGNFIRKPPSQNDYEVGASTNQGAGEVELETKINSSSSDRYAIGSPIKRTLFSAPSKFSYIQLSLASIHTAKSHIYSNNFFGQKKFYRDEFDFAKTPLHPTDRRKIRFGLKGIVDFIIQLDLHNLRELLLENDKKVEKFTTRASFCQNTFFADDSFFGLLSLVNPSKCQKLHVSVFSKC